MKKKVIRRVAKPKGKAHKTTVDGLRSTLHLKPVISLPRYKCKKCKHEWLPRTNEPMVCPRCHSPFSE